MVVLNITRSHDSASQAVECSVSLDLEAAISKSGHGRGNDTTERTLEGLKVASLGSTTTIVVVVVVVLVVILVVVLLVVLLVVLVIALVIALVVAGGLQREPSGR